MKIQLASDLHLEFLEARYPNERLITPALDADMLVLAGDIHNGEKAIKIFSDWPVPVFYVLGNHEFYGHSWEQTRQDIKGAARGTNVRVLDNDLFEMDGVRILGCTLWTDFREKGKLQSSCMSFVQSALNDYHVIRTQDGSLKAQDTLTDHELSRRWLECHLSAAYEGKTLVVSHHGPHPNSTHPRYLNNSNTNSGFVSDLTPLLEKADLWLHGHVHDSFDYADVGRCRVVTNPAGYVKNRNYARDSSEFVFENSEFSKTLVLEI